MEFPINKEFTSLPQTLPASTVEQNKNIPDLMHEVFSSLCLDELRKESLLNADSRTFNSILPFLTICSQAQDQDGKNRFYLRMRNLIGIPNEPSNNSEKFRLQSLSKCIFREGTALDESSFNAPFNDPLDALDVYEIQ